MSQIFAIKCGHFLGNFVLETWTMRAMNVDGTAVRCSGLGWWLHCSANMYSGIRNVSAVFLDCDLVDILRRSSLMPEHAQRNRTRSLDFKSRVSYSTHCVFYIPWTVHCDTHTSERPTWRTNFDMIYDMIWYGMIWYDMWERPTWCTHFDVM